MTNPYALPPEDPQQPQVPGSSNEGPYGNRPNNPVSHGSTPPPANNMPITGENPYATHDEIAKQAALVHQRRAEQREHQKGLPHSRVGAVGLALSVVGMLLWLISNGVGSEFGWMIYTIAPWIAVTGMAVGIVGTFQKDYNPLLAKAAIWFPIVSFIGFWGFMVIWFIVGSL